MNCPFCQAQNDETAEICRKCGKGLYALVDGSVLAGRYEIVQPLGKGGMGLVYKARDRDLRDVVAIKVLRSPSQSPEMARRFRSEIRFARRVRHPNVCAIHEFGQDGHLRFIVMEYVGGVDLKQLLRRHGPFPPDQAFDTVIQAARGLEAVHSASIVHRDLKTANIMRDVGGVVRLMDFGIAKQFEGDSGTGATMTGQVLGTPEYMSPEQARGHKVDLRTDLYALGVVLYELLTGDVPFRGETPVATLLMHIEEPPDLVGPKASRIPPAAIPVLQCALSKDKQHRYGSARAMLFALQDAIGHGSPSSSARTTTATLAGTNTLALAAEEPQTLTRAVTPSASPTLEGTRTSTSANTSWVNDAPASGPFAWRRLSVAAATAIVAVGAWMYSQVPGDRPVVRPPASLTTAVSEPPATTTAESVLTPTLTTPATLPQAARSLPAMPMRPVASSALPERGGKTVAPKSSPASPAVSERRTQGEEVMPSQTPPSLAREPEPPSSEVQPLLSSTPPSPPPPVTPPSPTVASPEPAAIGGERTAITQVLERYRRAIESRDLASLKEVWPGMPPSIERTIRDGFRFSQSHRVALKIKDVAVSGDAATATCDRSDEILSKEGQRLRNTSLARFILSKREASWFIEAIN